MDKEQEKVSETKQSTLNGVPISTSQLEETKQTLKGNERIVEVKSGDFRKLHRMQE